MQNLSQQVLPSKEFVESPPGGKPVPLESVFKETAANMGFPRDALSVAIITFARFFSVPLNQELMAKLRREILASGRASSPGAAAEKTALEAHALAALIAQDKGIVLSPEAL